MTDSTAPAKEYDLIVLGSGPAGEKGGAQAAYFGKSVALIEREPVVGGACVNTGTIPSKTLRETALHLAGLIQRNIGGVEISLRRDLSVLDFMRQKDDVVARQRYQIENNIRRHGIDYYRGEARFISPDTISIAQSGGGVENLRGRAILIATGSSPHQPAGIPFDHQKIYDSDTILTIDCIPKSLAVVGAGVIGCEYASIFAALGVKVSLIDGRTELLGHIDDEISDLLLKQLSERLKIDLHLGADVASIEPDEDSVNLTLTDGRVIDAQKVLYAAGRQSNTADLGLEAAGVLTGKRGLIPVNEHYQTNVPTIYAAGDVIGFPALASTSMEQARVAVVHAFDLKYKESVATLLPFGIYTIPEVATIGKSEEECRKLNIDYEVGRAWFRNNPRGMIIGDTDGLLKVIFDPKTLQIHGVHIVGENASDLLHVGMMVMQLGGTLSIFIDSVFNYPTLGDAYKYAAYDGLGNLAKRNKTDDSQA